jgi:hypothetical protein
MGALSQGPPFPSYPRTPRTTKYASAASDAKSELENPQEPRARGTGPRKAIGKSQKFGGKRSRRKRTPWEQPGGDDLRRGSTSHD